MDRSAAQSRLAHLMDGYLATQLLYVAASLDLPEALADGPRTADELAEVVDADPAALARVLRGLAAEDVLDEDGDGRFALTELGTLLRDSLRGPAVVRGGLYFRAAAGLLDAVRRGGTAFAHVYGEPFFDYLDQNPDAGSAFQDSMAGRSTREAAQVVAAYDFARVRRVVDVGGGRGVLLAAILGAAPHLSAVLLDRPAVAEQARDRLTSAGLADRCDVVGGDFFASVPAGADTYLLSRVLHDWDDESAVRILAACRRAVPDGGRLLVVDSVLPRFAREQPAAIRMDLHMLLLLGARERTAAEFERLLERSGWLLRRIVPTGAPDALSLLEAVPVPAAGADRDHVGGRASGGLSEGR
ncbi:methyltransferase [Cryptosporangium minutisporangium]|uniref:Methyltransferase n=1 Tax=Cryptosporangium minutisporangium TaxID=113569 RepID=A0ABP6T4F5_9ACTN